MRRRILIELSETDRLNNHIPDDVFDLCHDNDVFILDHATGEAIQILDFCEPGKGKQ